MNWDIEEEGSSVDGISHGLVRLFDWQLHFYSHIPHSGEYTEAQAIIKKIESNKKWQARVMKRSLAYFQIIKRWAEFI